MNNKWAIIGLGFISSRHIQAIKDVGDELILTCDNDEAKNADYTDHFSMMDDDRWKDVTHVAICTPNYLHAEMMRACEGKVILCEKPLTLSSKEILPENINVVLQMRYHPEVLKLKDATKSSTIHMVIRAKRDTSYWNGWKGDDEKSGGILYNFGVHYFDLLIYLLGNDYAVMNSERTKKLATGLIMFGDTLVKYHIEIMDTDAGQDRYFVWDDKYISISKKDNLSYENLHTKVYQELLAGRGITKEEAMKSIKLIEQL